MKPRTSFIYLFAFLLLAFNLLHVTTATIRYVSKTGSSTPPYTSWITASDSVQKCIDYAIAGDTIYVGNGVYKEKLVIKNKFLNLIGSGWDSCIVDSRELATPSDFFTIHVIGDVNISNFGIITSDNRTGDGFYIDAASNLSIVQKNKISGCAWGSNVFNSNINFKNNLITDVNRGIQLGAFNENYFPVIENNIIITVYNFSKGILGSYGSSSIIKNNYVISQEGGDGYYLILNPKEIRNNISEKVKDYNSDGFNFSLGNGMIENNLALSKTAAGRGMRLFRGSNKVRNNCLINGGNGYSVELPDAIDIKYNDAWNTENPFVGFSPDTTNLTIDPMIVSEDSSDFHLQMYSPLIDAGDPTILDKDSSRSDIGLYGGPFGEIYTYKDLAPKPPRNLTAIVDTNKIILRWNKNTEADTNYYNVYRDTTQNFSIDSTKLVSTLKDTALIQTMPIDVSRYVYKITCVDNQGNESNPSEEIVINLTAIRQLTDDYPMTINDYYLYQNFPNPFNPSTKIGYKLKERGYVKLMVYDIKGELVSILVNQEQEAGYYEVEFNIGVSGLQSSAGNRNSYSSGVYLYKIDVINQNQIPVFTEMQKMVYIK